MNELTREEQTEIYLMLCRGLVPYIKCCDVSLYQIGKLVDAMRKVGNALYAKKEKEYE